jgi:hypothetical protein
VSSEPEGGELAALRDLVQSDGWTRFTAFVSETWGADATLRRIEAQVSAQALGDAAAVQDATQHVLSAAKAARALVAWPALRIEQLAATQKPSRWRKDR